MKCRGYLVYFYFLFFIFLPSLDVILFYGKYILYKSQVVRGV